LGFPHFIYQSYLKLLKHHGVLVAGVTKNDPDLAVAPLKLSEAVLSADDFVAIVASYHPKSAQLAQLAERLNLGLDSFVFVDDNPVEIAEVSTALPQVRTVQFPARAGALPELLDGLSILFHREEVTGEDRDRTSMYRRMLDGMVPKDVGGADLSTFLSSLEMRLKILDRTTGDSTRAIQLINKTNQFNLNGVRRSPQEVGAILARGGRLFTASLEDRHGSHGEILSCLLDNEGRVLSLVMSCRVFQRRVEHAFLVWLSKGRPSGVRLEFIETERNAPLRQFLEDAAFTEDAKGWRLDLGSFAAAHRDVLELFLLEAAPVV
jgi:FkbH-like protein